MNIDESDVYNICQKVVSRYFDDSTTCSEEISTEITQQLMERLKPQPLPNLVSGHADHLTDIYRVRDLRQAIEGLPDDKAVMCQVVGRSSGVWNMHLDAYLTKTGNQWLVLTVTHPDVQVLPIELASADRDVLIDEMIAKLNLLRSTSP